jgi:integrase
MARGSEHLWFHGKKWYLKLTIPRPLQRYFLSSTGKPMSKIIEPLAGDHAIAKLKAAQRVAECAAIFARIKAGLITTPEQAKTALQRGPALDDEGNPIIPNPGFADRLRRAQQRWDEERRTAMFQGYADMMSAALGRPTASTAGETISQASEAWLAELTRDESAAPRDTTLDGHRLRVRAFVDAAGDVPLTEVTRAKASDFLAGLKVKNRTRNAYATTLKCVFECARRRGRFTGDNPFDGMKAKVAGSSYQPFTVAELQTLFNSMPREVEPKKHTPDTALPWVALIAAFSGMRLEEIAQLKTSDIREEGVNGGRLWCIDIHNGGENKLKNETSARLIPVHSALVHAGLLAYVKALPKGPLFPGLVRRESKGGKVGARLGELFRKKLVTLKLKRDGLCFHSFRHTVATALRRASVPQEDAARVLGHAVEGESYGTYAQAGPELIDVKATVEKIKYEGAAPLAQNEVGETT